MKVIRSFAQAFFPSQVQASSNFFYSPRLVFCADAGCPGKRQQTTVHAANR